VSTARMLALVRDQVQRFIYGDPLLNVISGRY
jgi:hypothetical protein